ncbi:25032_t:CDS:2 [Dentiscutata erythropus]|uniref:25032_t:CDS:1 n=1 Tax=Dentiscutata erythropus TaxID=1348616 RepID=A0A9N9BDN4_9GLOM|nr:25032_t:CDS:2 [Dentiscutata erythropus]
MPSALHYNNYSVTQVANLLYVSESLIRKVLWLYKKWGTVTNPWQKVRGRSKTFNRDNMNVEIISQMEIQCGKTVSISTMWRSLAYCGITWKKVFNLFILM